MWRRGAFVVVLIAAHLFGAGATAQAADTVRVAKPSNTTWAFLPLDVGDAEGIFARYGIAVEISGLGGDAKIQQALAADSLDVGLGSGPSMAFVAKGSPVITVAAFAGAPRNLSIIIAADSTIKSAADLKGKSLSITTVGSLTEWLVKRVSVQEGWGPDGIKGVALGGFDAATAALKTHQIDGMTASTENGYFMEEHGMGRVFLGMEKYAPEFHAHVIFARQSLVASNPDLVRRFLQGFFASIAFMKANKEKTTAIAMRVLDRSATSMNKTYDDEIAMLEDDGNFDPKAIEVLKQSFVDMNILTTKPSDDQILTTAFVPVKP